MIVLVDGGDVLEIPWCNCLRIWGKFCANEFLNFELLLIAFLCRLYLNSTWIVCCFCFFLWNVSAAKFEQRFSPQEFLSKATHPQRERWIWRVCRHWWGCRTMPSRPISMIGKFTFNLILFVQLDMIPNLEFWAPSGIRVRAQCIKFDLTVPTRMSFLIHYARKSGQK